MKGFYINYSTYEIAKYWQDLTCEEGDEIGYILHNNINHPLYTFCIGQLGYEI